MCCCGIDENKVVADIQIPGVDKKDIQVHTFEDGFRLDAPARDVIYSGIYYVGCKTEAAKTKATYENGVLHLEIPVIEMEDETKITVT
jgi:HSP20 family molecular chaperone IbpA